MINLIWFFYVKIEFYCIIILPMIQYPLGDEDASNNIRKVQGQKN